MRSIGTGIAAALAAGLVAPAAGGRAAAGAIRVATIPAVRAASAPSCRLPMYGSGVADLGDGTGPPRAGFLLLPRGRWRVDPAGTIVDDGPGLFRTLARPVLVGSEAAATYLPRQGRWVPASPAAVAPGGASYAYSGPPPIAPDGAIGRGPTPIRVVQIASGRSRTVLDRGDWNVLADRGGTLYLVGHPFGSDTTQGLYRLGPGAVAPVLVRAPSPTASWVLVDRVAAFGLGLNPADRSAPPVSAPADSVVRYDLARRRAVVWLYRPAIQLALVAVTAAGDPLVVADGRAGSALLLVTAPGRARTLLRGSGMLRPGTLEVGSALTSATGTWVATDRGLYLLDAGGRLTLALRGTFTTVSLAGGCA